MKYGGEYKWSMLYSVNVCGALSIGAAVMPWPATLSVVTK